jgi:NAD(P)-dependent dehydrogenase (short-subunit alcohol dehydrogenase family)
MKNQKVWLVIGASKTLSILMVKHLLAMKQLVIATTNNNTAFDTVLLNNSDLTIISLDITQQQEVEKMVKKIIKQHGRIDVLINNAGFLRGLEEGQVEEIIKAF